MSIILWRKLLTNEYQYFVFWLMKAHSRVAVTKIVQEYVLPILVYQMNVVVLYQNNYQINILSTSLSKWKISNKRLCRKAMDKMQDNKPSLLSLRLTKMRHNKYILQRNMLTDLDNRVTTHPWMYDWSRRHNTHCT